MATITDDPILKRLRVALDHLYGGWIERVVLFGSRARGEAREDSDYDVALFLRDLTDRWHELDRLADLRTELLEDVGVFVDAKPYPAGAYRDRTTLMREIRREGVDLRHRDDPLNLVMEITGYRGEDAKDNADTMDAYWVPGVNNLGTFDCWAFAEFKESVYAIAANFDALIERAITGRTA